MNTQNSEFDALIQTELTNDTEFQSTLATISDETEKANAIEAKKKEVLAKKAPEWFAEAAKHKEIAENQRIRAEKAEGKKKDEGDGGTKKDEDLSSTDVIALIGADIKHPDDIAEIKRAAKLFGKTITEIIQDPLLKAKLKQNSEFRAAQQAANVDPKRAGTNQATDSEILERARKGEVFKAGSAEAEQLYWARRGGKRT